MVFKKSRPFFLGIEKPPFVVGVLDDLVKKFYYDVGKII
jgi:hypothetical protein